MDGDAIFKDRKDFRAELVGTAAEFNTCCRKHSLFSRFPKLDSILRTILFKYLLPMPSGFNHGVSEGAIVGDL